MKQPEKSATKTARLQKWKAVMKAIKSSVLFVAILLSICALGQESITSPLSGVAVAQQSFTVALAAQAIPACAVSAAPVDFGQVVVGKSKESDLVAIADAAGGPCTVLGVTTSSPLFVADNSNLPVTLQPGEQVGVTITFSPTEVGTFTADATVNYDDVQQ